MARGKQTTGQVHLALAPNIDADGWQDILSLVFSRLRDLIGDPKATETSVALLKTIREMGFSQSDTALIRRMLQRLQIVVSTGKRGGFGTGHKSMVVTDAHFKVLNSMPRVSVAWEELQAEDELQRELRALRKQVAVPAAAQPAAAPAAPEATAPPAIAATPALSLETIGQQVLALKHLDGVILEKDRLLSENVILIEELQATVQSLRDELAALRAGVAAQSGPAVTELQATLDDIVRRYGIGSASS